MNKQKLLMIGSGSIAEQMAELLNSQSDTEWQLFGLRRNIKGLKGYIEPIAADYTDAKALEDVMQKVQPDYVLLTLTPSAYTEQAYRESYIEVTHNLIQACGHLSLQPELVIFASSTSVYSQNDGSWVTEDSVLLSQEENQNKELGQLASFSADTMLACESLLKNSTLESCSIRFAGIYANDTLRLVNKVCSGNLSNSTAYSNRIHREDCAGVLAHILNLHVAGQPVQECYNAVDNEPCSVLDVEQWLLENIKSSVLEKAQAEGDNKLGLQMKARRKPASKRCSNQRLHDSGFRFKYSDFRQGYTEVLRQSNMLKLK